MYRSTLSFLFIMLCCVSGAFAQGGTGEWSGNVVDANGAVVAGATVKLTSGVTAQEREATTNDSGDFAFTLLPAGVDKLEITASGFRTVTIDEVRINVTQTTTLPIRLDAATVSGMVTINAEAPLVQQETSQVGRTIEENTIRQLPLPTRNFQQLLTLSPGTSSSVANNTELGRGDAITKSGGNDFHGNAYYFLRNKALNANDFFLNAAGRERPTLSRNQFGGTLGGPIIKYRLFFFGSYQGTRERNGASLNNSLMSPTIPPALRDDNRTVAGLAAAFNLP